MEGGRDGGVGTGGGGEEKEAPTERRKEGEEDGGGRRRKDGVLGQVGGGDEGALDAPLCASGGERS